jgi:ribosomal protein L7/L12
MTSEDRMIRLERQVDYLYRRLQIDPGEAFAADFGELAGEGLPPSFHMALTQGKKIEAIKIYREATGASLKEAKNAVDSMAPW